jgi:hypothetical protein
VVNIASALAMVMLVFDAAEPEASCKATFAAGLGQ